MKILFLLLLIIGCTKEKTITKEVRPAVVKNSPSLNKIDLEYKRKMDLEHKAEQAKKDCLKAFYLKYKEDQATRQEYSKLCQKKHNNGYCHDISDLELAPLLKKICK